MSELKAYIGPHPTDHTLTEYYLKSEADKVIAEKDDVIEELKRKLDIYKRGWEENDKINAHLYAELRHQKYKLCRAKAEEYK